MILEKRRSGPWSFPEKFSVSFGSRDKNRDEDDSEEKPEGKMISGQYLSGKSSKNKRESNTQYIQNGMFFEDQRIKDMKKDERSSHEKETDGEKEWEKKGKHSQKKGQFYGSI